MKRFITLCLLGMVQLGMAQDLEGYIRQAIAENPQLRANHLRYDLAGEKADEARAIPNTEFGLGYFASEPETRTGAQKLRFSVRQMLPWFGTLDVRQQYAQSMAEAEYLDYVIARRQLALEVTQSFYELYRLQAQQRVLGENLALLATYETLALNALEVGKASAVDVLRVQIRQNQLRQEQEVIREGYRAAQAAFNALRSQPAETPVLVPEAMELPVEAAVQSDSLALNPELLRFDKLYASVLEAERLNQKESAPMLGVGLDYVPVAERTDMVLPDSGKDIIMPMVSVSIPLFNSPFASRSRQNALRTQELEAMRQERRNALEAALQKAVSGRNAARVRFETQGKNLEQARDAEQILIRQYETGVVEFKELLELLEMQWNFQLSRIAAVQDYYNENARIQYITN